MATKRFPVHWTSHRVQLNPSLRNGRNIALGLNLPRSGHPHKLNKRGHQYTCDTLKELQWIWWERVYILELSARMGEWQRENWKKLAWNLAWNSFKGMSETLKLTGRGFFGLILEDTLYPQGNYDWREDIFSSLVLNPIRKLWLHFKGVPDPWAT